MQYDVKQYRCIGRQMERTKQLTGYIEHCKKAIVEEQVGLPQSEPRVRSLALAIMNANDRLHIATASTGSSWRRRVSAAPTVDVSRSADGVSAAARGKHKAADT